MFSRISKIFIKSSHKLPKSVEYLKCKTPSKCKQNIKCDNISDDLLPLFFIGNDVPCKTKIEKTLIDPDF